MGYHDDRAWTDKLLRDATWRPLWWHVGPHPQWRVADDTEDKEHATDIFVNRDGVPLRVAVRFRDVSYLERFGMQDFTVRASRPSGAPTELEKILSGYGDLMFYGWATRDRKSVKHWLLLDLDVFRRRYRSGLGRLMSNFDDSSAFYIFSIGDFPGIVAAHGPHMDELWPALYVRGEHDRRNTCQE
jgi:hypothetical protein